MGKRILSLILAVVLTCGLLCVPTLAAVTDYPKEFREGSTLAAQRYDNTFLALQKDGSLWAMGDISALGKDGPYDKAVKEYFEPDDEEYYTTYYAGTPKKIAEAVASFEIGPAGFCVIKTDGSLYMASFDVNRGATGLVKKLDHVSEVSVGKQVLAVREDGTLWAWGSDWNGGLGFGDRVPTPSARSDFEKYYTDQPVQIMENVAHVDTAVHSMALLRDGSVWCWGYNSSGEVGTGTIPSVTGGHINEDRSTIWLEIGVSEAYERTPVKVMDGVKQIFAGSGYSCAIKNDGSLWAWGDVPGWCPDGVGQPSPVKLGEDIKTVFSEFGSNMPVIKNDNTLWNYGSNGKTPDKLMDDVDTVCSIGGHRRGIVLKKDGTVWDIQYLYDAPATIERHAGKIDQAVYISEGLTIKENGSLFVDGDNHGVRLGEQSQDFYDVGQEYLSTPVQLTGPANTPVQSGGEPQAVSKTAFTDVPAASPYVDAVNWAVEKQITAGTTATTFSPKATCTTAQILTFLWRANGSPEPTAANPFTDVAGNAYYEKAAVWAYEKGMASGTTLTGDAPCTRSATVSALWKLAGQPAAASKAAFTDVSDGADYAQAVAWAVEQGITAGTSATAFSPDATCTRGQIVTFLYRDMAK